MQFNHLMSVYVLLAMCMIVGHAGTIPSSTESVHGTGEVDLYKNDKKECNDHSQCSCTGGIPICWHGSCNCIYTNLLCFEHKHCGDLCGSGVGICLLNACKCYNLVEDTKLTESISPWEHEVP